MSKQYKVDGAGLTAGVAASAMAVVDIIDAHTQRKHKEGKVTLGVAFFIIGCALPYACGIHDNASFQLISGVFFSVVGAIIATIINYKSAKKTRKRCSGLK